MRRWGIALVVGVLLLPACGQRPGTHAVAAGPPVAAVTPTTPATATPTDDPTTAGAATPEPTTAAVAEPSETEVADAEPSPAPDDEAVPPPTEQTSEPEADPEPEETEGPPTAAVDHGAPLWDRSFRSQRVTEDGRERAWAEGTTLEIEFQRDRPNDGDSADDLGWYAGCNWTTSGLRVKPDQLMVAGGMSTMIGCYEPRASQDDWVRRFLHSDPRWILDGGTLTLTSGDTTIVFREIPPEDRKRPGQD